MYRTILRSKIHRATVTQADLHYVGSLTLDADLIDAAGLVVHELVHVLDITNGARLETYIIEGPRGSGIVGINGAAARLVHTGDLIIVVAYGLVPEDKIKEVQPRVVLVDDHNQVTGYVDSGTAG